MSDDMFDTEEEISTEDSGGRQGGFLPSIVVQILKWVAIAVGVIVFIVTVVVITVNLLFEGRQQQTGLMSSEAYRSAPPRRAWSSDIGEIRTRTADATPSTVIVEINLGFEEGATQIQSEILARRPQLRDLVRNFFGSKTARELRPDNEQVVKDDLRRLINDAMPGDPIREIAFDRFEVVDF
ncbi:flagellar basal body-associated FliL family protein [Spirochaeta africana]|uniref:Flagellar protein FliL n=1 Tax=Spirochaeta africana (strain ATCC 700263 / DSM 8902 / Z-7692) TaxID=889378 RepID=H9UKU8_SPIAZ|nr:flagellar basal body-associated FliL family protein [Spirochaeta africana]AFG38141.1 flagellar basal body-associated protein [Spirochaeta africana DSM 8902]